MLDAFYCCHLGPFTDEHPRWIQSFPTAPMALAAIGADLDWALELESGSVISLGFPVTLDGKTVAVAKTSPHFDAIMARA